MRPVDIRPCLLLLLGLAGTALASEAPSGLSPGELAREAELEDPCPVFSWGDVDGAQGYDLRVYQLHDNEMRPVVSEHFDGAVDGWTPPIGRCLEPGRRYAWSVRAVVFDRTSSWSPPRLFRVAEPLPEMGLEEAIEVVRSYLEARHDTRASILSAPQIESLTRLVSDLERPGASAVAPTALTVDGGFQATSLTGDGSTLTNLQPQSIAPGTAGFSVTGSSGDVSCNGCVISSNFGSGQVKSTDIGTGQVTGSDIDPSTVQAKITGSCSLGQVTREVGSDGSLTCSSNTRVLLGQEFFVANFNGGSSSVSASRTNRLCFLTHVRLRDLDGGDTASCKIELSSGGGFWVLYAASQGDADAQCRMRCIEVSPNRTF